jgi:hypothetical protein
MLMPQRKCHVNTVSAIGRSVAHRSYGIPCGRTPIFRQSFVTNVAKIANVKNHMRCDGAQLETLFFGHVGHLVRNIDTAGAYRQSPKRVGCITPDVSFFA